MSGGIFCFINTIKRQIYRWHKDQFSPIWHGVVFFLVVPLPLSSISFYYDKDHIGNDPILYLTYIDSISWSVSMFYLFPLMLVLSIKYYRAIPSMFFNSLIGKFIIPKKDKLGVVWEYKKKIYHIYKNKWIPFTAIFASVVLTVIYVNGLINNKSINSWMISHFCKQGSEDITYVGIYALVVQVLLISWVIILVLKTFLFYRQLNKLFNDHRFDVNLPLTYPDGACGLSVITRVTSLFNLSLFLIGLYLSLKVIDKWIIQDLGLFTDIGNPLMLASYLLLAPLLFFLPLWAPHQIMKKEKLNFIEPIGRQIETYINNIGINHSASETELNILKGMSQLKKDLIKDIPVWPFDVRSMQAFFGAIIIPILPTILPFITKGIELIIN